MKQQNTSIKNYTQEHEIKSKIVYEGLCDNFGKKVVDGVMKQLKMEMLELSEDFKVKRFINVLKGKI